MNTFASAVATQPARTKNDMLAFQSTSSPLVDLFYAIGASRGKNIIPAFTAAYVEDKELALRVALWARDVRGGAGERGADCGRPCDSGGGAFGAGYLHAAA